MKKKTFCLLSFLFSAACSNEIQWIVGDINFIGNKTFEKDILIDQMQLKPPAFFGKTEYSPSQLQLDIDQLENFYQNRGFFDTEITSDLQFDTTHNMVTINLIINEGIRTELDSIIFVGNVIYSNSFLSDLIDRRRGQVLDSSLYVGAQSEILDFLASQGRLFARVERFFVFDSTGKTANLIFTINEGPVLKAGDLEILGLVRVLENVIKREVQFEPGEVITSEKLRSSVRNLYATGLFELVNIIPVDTQIYPSETDSIIAPLLIQIDETNFFDVRFGAGYNSIDKWYAGVELIYKNLFGLGHRISLSGKVSTIMLQSQIDYAYPWLFGKDLLGEVSAFIERRNLQSFTGLYQGGLLGINGNMGLKNRYRLWTSFKHTGWISGIPQEEELEKRNTLLFGTRITRDTRLTIFNPGSAYFGYIEAEIAGPAMSWSNQFFRLKTDMRGYLGLFSNKLNLSTALFVGYINNYGRSDLVPTSELLRIGIDAVRPVRGYIEQEVSPVNSEGEATGGKLAFVVNLFNLRFPIYSIIAGELFMDGGYVWPAFDDFDPENVKWSTGPGLLVNLPTAIIRIDYGFKLDNTSHLDGGWYFGIGYAF